MTPEQEEQVRRALAAARAGGDGSPATMPPEVAARLDRVLAELVEGRATHATASSDGAAAGTDELGARRARRWPHVLVAAAAVAVIALAGGAVVIRGTGAGSSSDSTASRSRAGSPGGEASGPGPSSGLRGAAPSPDDARDARTEPRLRSSSLAADVQRVVDAGPVPAAPAGPASSDSGGVRGERADGAVCGRPAVPRGADVVDVRLDGRPATLVLAAPAGRTREARVYACSDASSPVTTATVRRR